MSRTSLHRVAAALVLVAAPAGAAHAQQSSRPPVRAEAALEATAGNIDLLHLLGGANLPLGSYVRLGLFAGGGVARDDGVTVGSARADASVRFLLDPYRQSRWGLSAGGGLSVQHEPGTTHGWLTVTLDLEGPPSGSVVPAVHVGLGGGARVGVSLRARGRPGWR